MTRSFDTTDVNVVTMPGGQRVHAGHANQSEVLTAGFNEVRKGRVELCRQRFVEPVFY
jgi:hypothetical protein